MNTKYDDEEQMEYLKQWQLNKKQKEEMGMFKNCVFKPDVDTVKWIKAAGVRAIKTMAETAIPMIPIGVSITAVDWKVVLGVCLCSGVLSLIISVAGIPEVEVKEEISNEQ